MEAQVKEGWIEVITGCMFAGKTEEFLRRIRRLEYAKKNVLVFKPLLDTRYSSEEIVSHNNERTKSIGISKSNDILDYLDDDIYAVAIDEVQFLDRAVVSICEKMANQGIRVIVAGLDTDFRGEPFGVMPELMTRAEFVTKLNAICQVCGALATKTQRLIDAVPARYEDPIILVGAKEQYEARCRHCHEIK